MAALFSMAEILAATGGRPVGDLPEAVGSVSIDSRELQPGALFVAIRGERFDGHDFVADALGKGAAAALVSADRAAGPGQGLIVVPDPLEGLRQLARAARARMAGKVVAVTGSAGKTTTREAIRLALASAGPTHASVKSFNNHWGVPLSLARMPRETRFGVFEIGMNHAGEITPLTRLVRPHIAVVTTVAPAHLEFFGSTEAIARAKAEIFLGLESGGTAVLNADHPYLGLLVEAARAQGAGVVTYGFGEADWRIETMTPTREGALVRLRHGDDAFELRLAAHGRHMAANAVAALAVAGAAGLDPAQTAEALAGFAAPEGRGAESRLGPPERPLTLIDESYNANPASMIAALEAFAARPKGEGAKVLVLGDMLELGPEGPDLHRALAEAVAASGADRVYLVGEQMAELGEALGRGVAAHARDMDGIVEPVLNSLAYGDAIMVKGSNGVRLGALVRAIRQRFS